MTHNTPDYLHSKQDDSTIHRNEITDENIMRNKISNKFIDNSRVINHHQKPIDREIKLDP